MQRVVVAALGVMALVLAAGLAQAQARFGAVDAFPPAPLLAQSEPQPGAATGAYVPPPRGAPGSRVGGGSRDIGAERRVALVVGNQRYQHLARLATPANDAQLIAATLQSLGFEGLR